MSAELIYREISCSKSVDKENFSQGVQDYSFSTGAPTGWIPSRSYFRIEMTLDGLGVPADGLGSQPTLRQQLAFADSACGNLYDNVYFKGAGQDISTAVNYVGQSNALKNRLQKTGSWLQSVGKSAYLLESDFQKRVKQVSRDAGINPEDEGERVFIGDDTHQLTGTVALTAATGTTQGADTNLMQLKIGDTLVVAGVPYTCSVAPTNADGTNGRVIPRPTADTGAITDAYIIKNKRRDGGQRNKVYALWVPPIGIFDHDGILGAGDWRISLNPSSNYKQSAVETRQGTDTAAVNPTQTATGGYNLIIHSVKFYVATVKAQIPQGISSLYLMESMVQSKPLSSRDGQYEFTVPSSTRALTIFLQSNKAGSNPRFPPSMFKLPLDSDLLLESLQITYANTTKPSTRWSSSYSEVKDGAIGNPSINELQQRYNDSLQESGLLMSSGGAETFKDYLSRGPYYHFSYTRDSEDKSTQVQIAAKVGFDPAAVPSNLFIVSWYSRGIEITTHNGQIQEVRSLSV